MDVPQSWYFDDNLPPTTNMLDDRQRKRLVRSARKLGAVLGATPKMIELESEYLDAYYSAPSRGATPDLVYCSSSASSSMVSLVPSDAPPRRSTDSERSTASLPLERPPPQKHTRSRSKPLPKPLVLRLNAVPTLPADRRLQVTPPTPLTATTITTPTTPVAPSLAEMRRRRMAKLKRTLGENVPVDAVFHPSPSRSRTRPSTPVRPKQLAGSRLPRHPSPEPPLPPRPTAQQQTQPKPAQAPVVKKTQRRRSKSVDHAALVVARSSRVWVTGNNAWVGEWNRKDIGEVQQQLRSLRL